MTMAKRVRELIAELELEEESSEELRFKQIACGKRGLFGLDLSGRVWVLNERSTAWQLLSMLNAHK